MPKLLSRACLRGLGVILLIVGICAGAVSARAAPRAIQVAAASDLRFVLPGIADDFTAETGIPVHLTFGSSGNFTRQILAGAPFDLFLSADAGYAKTLTDAGRTTGEGTRYATGRIVLFLPKAPSPGSGRSWNQVLGQQLDQGRIRRFAIANPAHAPYGRAAAEALRATGLWDRVAVHLILGESAAQAAQFAASGSADGGIIPQAIARSVPFHEKGTFLDIPAADHAPLHHVMVILKGAASDAQVFYDHLRTPGVRTTLGHFGFEAIE